MNTFHCLKNLVQHGWMAHMIELQLKVFLAYVSHADEAGKAFPSSRTIARYNQMSEKSAPNVRAARASLVRRGWLKRLPTEQGPRGRSVYPYLIRMPTGEAPAVTRRCATRGPAAEPRKRTGDPVAEGTTLAPVAEPATAECRRSDDGPPLPKPHTEESRGRESGKMNIDAVLEQRLNVLRADNTMGKSTCVRSILFALGLDAMLTTSRNEVPLLPAMKSRLESPDRGEVDVLESQVFLEIENARKRRIVVQRTAKGSRSTHLVTVFDGPVLTAPTTVARSEDFYVAWPGAATKERGFHQYLAELLGWTLPSVANFDGDKVPLYLECIFPFAVVEQMRGWSSLQPPVPTQFRIRETHKRVVEFLLDLDAYRIAAERLAIREEKDRIQKRWYAAVEEAKAAAASVSCVTQSISAEPDSTWPPEVSPQILVVRDETWLTLGEVDDAARTELATLLNEELPKVADIANAAAARLAEAERALKSREAMIPRVLSALDMERQEAEAVTERLEAIEEDLQRNKDVQTLQQMGSKFTNLVSSGICPTCKQTVQDCLIMLPLGQQVMPVRENIRFIEEQRRTFRAVQNNSAEVVRAREAQLLTLRAEANALRSEIRSLRQTLVSDGRLPSIAAIERRLQLEKTIDAHKAALERFAAVLKDFAGLSKQWAAAQIASQKLPRGDTTSADNQKLKLFEAQFVEQLTQYGFRSVPLGMVSISTDTYRPEHDGFDL